MLRGKDGSKTTQSIRQFLLIFLHEGDPITLYNPIEVVSIFFSIVPAKPRYPPITPLYYPWAVLAGLAGKRLQVHVLLACLNVSWVAGDPLKIAGLDIGHANEAQSYKSHTYNLQRHWSKPKQHPVQEPHSAITYRQHTVSKITHPRSLINDSLKQTGFQVCVPIPKFVSFALPTPVRRSKSKSQKPHTNQHQTNMASVTKSLIFSVISPRVGVFLSCRPEITAFFSSPTATPRLPIQGFGGIC